MAPEKLRKKEEKEEAAAVSATEYKKQSRTEPPGWGRNMKSCHLTIIVKTLNFLLYMFGDNIIYHWPYIFSLTVLSLLAYSQMDLWGMYIIDCKHLVCFTKFHYSVKSHSKITPAVGKPPLLTHWQNSSRWRCTLRTKSSSQKFSTKRENRYVR